MFDFRPTYEPLIKCCKELIAENKALMEENGELKAELKQNRFSLKHTEDVNSLLRETVKTVNMKRAELEKRVADLEEQLAKKVFLLDDEGTPIKSFTLAGKLTQMDKPEPNEEKIEAGKWYHTTDFTKEELEALLPIGTKVEVEAEVHYKDMATKEPENTVISEVEDIVQGNIEGRLLINIGSWFNREWFKIIEE